MQSLKVHLSEEFSDTPFYLRILRPQRESEIKESDLYAMSSFSDILIEERLYLPEKQGSFDIDLSNYKISIDKEGLFMLFVQIDTGEEVYRNSNDQLRKEMIILFVYMVIPLVRRNSERKKYLPHFILEPPLA